MTLILFDIDGTLTATNAVDEKCYAAAFIEVFGIPLPSTDWSVYVHCTDFAIADEALVAARGKPATPEERAAYEAAFVRALETECAANPKGFREVPGAQAILQAIDARDDMHAAIATGGMRGSACYKLSRIGVDALAMPAGFANDAHAREDIIRCAIERADGHADPDMVYVGDGSWDLKTAARLGMRFIGIVDKTPPEWFRANGANALLYDYSDQEAFFDAVRSAAVPKLGGQ